MDVIVKDKSGGSFQDSIDRMRQKSQLPETMEQKFGKKRAEEIKRINSRILGEKD